MKLNSAISAPANAAWRAGCCRKGEQFPISTCKCDFYSGVNRKLGWLVGRLVDDKRSMGEVI